MRNLHLLDVYRRVDNSIANQFGFFGDDTCGAFSVPSPTDRTPLLVIASSDEGWDHVSVSHQRRIPNWIEMEHIKRLFFKDEETAMQLHVPPSDHINCCERCLHIWRPHNLEIPRPPQWMVGPSKEVA